MKVFVSWSGRTSHQVALALRDWLPRVIQVLEPWVSSEDIWKGQHWALTLNDELASTKYAILCLTRENLASPWLNFEAGAVANLLDSRVIPFLFDMKSTQLEGPLSLLQYATYEHENQGSRDEMLKVLQSLNQAEGKPILKDSILSEALDDQWEKLNARLGEIARSASRITDTSAPEASAPTTDEVLATILDSVRTQQRELIRLRRDFRLLGLKPISVSESVRPTAVRRSQIARIFTEASQTLWDNLGRVPSLNEIADYMDMSPSELREFIDEGLAGDAEIATKPPATDTKPPTDPTAA